MFAGFLICSICSSSSFSFSTLNLAGKTAGVRKHQIGRFAGRGIGLGGARSVIWYVSTASIASERLEIGEAW